MITRLPSLLLWPLLRLALASLLALAFAGPAAAAAPPCHHAQAMAAPGKAAPAAVHVRSGHAPSCVRHAPGAGHDHGRCASCPACCAGVALAPAPWPALPDAGPAFVAVPFRAGHVPSVDPALPERPPRPSLA